MSSDYQLEGDVAVITFNRPDRFNAIEPTLARGVVESLARAGSEARAVVLTGAGKAFCSGADLAYLIDDYEADGPDLAAFLDEAFHPVVHALIECKVPTVAAINGVAAGAGLGLSLACDLRVMAQSAFLTSAFTAIGLAPDSGTTWWLPQMVGVSKAIELTMTNKRVGAEEARELGLCLEVASTDEVVEKAVDLAGTMADLVPDSLVTTRRLIREAPSKSFLEALVAERSEQARLGRTPEHLEGVHAFLEKRKPDFRGAE
jgi:2-(1,2-epoxy-1,2-dihydrophenyl)acetyl-CoA isomerase